MWTLFAIICVFSPMLSRHFVLLWHSSQYQFFPILIAGIAVVLHDRNAKPHELNGWHAATRSGPMMLGLASMGVLLFATLIDTPNVAMFAFMLFSAGLVWHVQKQSGKSYLGPWMLGWLLVQLPGFVERKLTQSLQLFSSKVSSQLLDWIGLNHLMTGNVLRFAERDLFVDEACSGVISLFSILAFGAMYIVWQKHPALRAILLLVVGVCCTVLLNVLRISSIAIADQWFDIDLIHGLPHTILGVILFCGTLTVFYCTDQVLGKILKPLPVLPGQRLNRVDKTWNRLTEIRTFENKQDRRHQSASDRRNRESKVTTIVLVACATIVLTVWAGRFFLLAASNQTDILAKSVAEKIDSEMLTTAPGEVRYEEVERDLRDAAGQFSKVFHVVSDDDLAYNMSVDYPFTGQWHELTNCYEVLAWTITNRTIAISDDEGWGLVEVEFTNTQGEFGYLLFSFVDANGNDVVTPDQSNFLNYFLFDMNRRMTKGFASKTIQLQLWHTSKTKTTEESRNRLKKEFLNFRSLARKQMFGSDPPHTP